MLTPERGETVNETAPDSQEEYEDNTEIDADDDDYDRDLPASRKIDKIITILGIAVGVVILVIAIIVIIKMVKLFSGDSSSKPPVQTSEQTKPDNLVEVPSLLGDIPMLILKVRYSGRA